MNTSPTAMPTKKRILAATIAAFIITALLGTGIVVIIEKNRSQKQQKVVVDITIRVADNIQDHLNRSVSATYALAAIIRQNNGSIDNFETLASEMLEMYGGMSSLAIAPQGIVSSIVPLAGNEKAIGHNLLEDVKRNKEAILAMNTRKLTLAGPFELLQGGRAVAGRLPVFIEAADGTDRFWGFTAVLVGIPQLMKSVNLQQIVDSGYHYELSRIHPDSGKRDVFERSTETALSSPVSHDIEIPNGTWTLSVEQMGGWFSPLIIPCEIMLVLLVSALISFMLHTLYKLPLTLQQSEERFRALATIAPVGIFYADGDGNFLYVNPEWLRIAGLSLEESLGVGWVKGLHPDDRDMVSSSWNKMVASHGQWELEYRFMTGEGKITWVHGLAASQHDASGKVIKYVGIMQDITERKQAEEEKINLETQLHQAHKMETVGTMAGGIAHEFNNLLAIITGNIDIVQHKQNSGTSAAENVAHIKDATNRAKNLVTQILAFGRLEKPALVSIDLVKAVTESLKLLRSTTPVTIEIMTRFADKPIAVNADTTQLQQVIINLASNAAHAMDDKGLLTVAVGTEVLASVDMPKAGNLKPGPFAKISVSDTGTGMDKQTLKRIFDPFFTTKEVGVGSGMGLSVIHGIVDQHGGFITVDSTVGAGSTFNIFLPVINEGVSIQPVDKEPALPTGTERILFVDDEECIAYTCNELLECQGYKVTSVTNGIEALDLFKANPDAFDLVFTDQTMPVVTGAELATELLKIRPDLPIILCSGYSARVSEEDAKGIGIREFCMKPMDMKQLAIVARRVLDEETN